MKRKEQLVCSIGTYSIAYLYPDERFQVRDRIGLAEFATLGTLAEAVAHLKKVIAIEIDGQAREWEQPKLGSDGFLPIRPFVEVQND